ncbi:hypothetical protein Tco_1335566 [Tanacetum coccineum]
MARLSSIGSVYGDDINPTYDLDILSKVPHYDTYHETDMLNIVVQEMEYSKHLVHNNDSYDELTSDNNAISYVDYMTTIENDAAQSVPPLEQDNVMTLSVIEQMQSQVERCNTVNQETKNVNESLTTLGYQNPLYLRQARQQQRVLYNANVLAERHDPIIVCDSEETLILAEESSKPIPPVAVEKPTPTKVFPKKLPTTNMVKDNLQKAKNHLDKFDECIKERTVVTATIWGN